jgi:hypothetical protein
VTEIFQTETIKVSKVDYLKMFENKNEDENRMAKNKKIK